MKTILAASNLLKIENIVLYPDEIRIIVKTKRKWSICPCCNWKSDKVHCRYKRYLTDLPWEGVAVKVILSVRKFFCMNYECSRKIYCESIPELVATYARKTLHLNNLHKSLGIELGGKAGTRMASKIGIPIGRDAILNSVRHAAPPPVNPVHILGVDDFAFRRGKKYGTILVDHESGAVIDLLPDRETATLAQWLKEHPEVQIVTRDRSSAYSAGIRNGAPQAEQVADRWHIIINLSEALERLLIRYRNLIREASAPIIKLTKSSPQPQSYDHVVVSLQNFLPKQKRKKEILERREEQAALFQEVIELKRKGITNPEIVTRVGKSTRTILRWLKRGEYRVPVRHRRSKLEHHYSYIVRRWNEGCRNITKLWQEIVNHGYMGSYKSLYHYLKGQDYLYHSITNSQTTSIQEVKPDCRVRIERLIPTPSPRKTVWMLLKSERLDDKQQKMIDNLYRLSLEVEMARHLANSFIAMVKERRSEDFGEWVIKVKEGNIPELRSFANSLMQDKEAVMAALKYEWSNGRVEGQVNRLKFIKRQMFGRAKFDLLKARVLQAT